MLSDFVRETGKTNFTYYDVQEWFFGSQWKGRISWHTVERHLRKLAQHNFIARKQEGKTVRFFVQDPEGVMKFKELKKKYLLLRANGELLKLKEVVEEVSELFGVSIKDAVELLTS